MTYLLSIKIESLKRNLFAPPFCHQRRRRIPSSSFLWKCMKKGRNCKKTCSGLQSLPENRLVLRMSIKRTFNRHTNAVRINIVATCFPLRGKCRRQYVQANWIFRSVATLKSSERPFRAQRDGECQRASNNAQYTVVLPPQPSGQLPRWGAKTFHHFSLSLEVNKSLY